MKNREWKDVIAFAVFLVTFAGLLFGFYNGIRADMRDMRTEMREMNGTLTDVRERLAVIETHIGIETSRSTEQGPVEESVAEKGLMERIVRDVIPAPLAWWVDVYAMRSAQNISSRPL